jgi:hypothetical protein
MATPLSGLSWVKVRLKLPVQKTNRPLLASQSVIRGTGSGFHSIRSIHGTTVFAHQEKGFFCQIKVLTDQNAFETSGAPLVHSNSIYSSIIERVQ